jgi:hypothetical protein
MGGAAQRALARAAVAGFFAHGRVYEDLASDGLQRFTALLMAAELPLGPHVQSTLAWHEHVIARTALLRVREALGPAKDSDESGHCCVHLSAGRLAEDGVASAMAAAEAMERHACLQRLASGDAAFVRGELGAETLAWLAALPPRRGGGGGGGVRERRGARHVYDAWRARVEAQCNADESIASLGVAQDLLPLTELVGAKLRDSRRDSATVVSAQAGSGRFHLARAPWLFLDRGLRAVATRGSGGSPDWVAIAQVLKSQGKRERNIGAACDAAARHAEAGDEAAEWPSELQMRRRVVAEGGWAHCLELARARALPWHDLLRCSAALERADAVVRAVPL